MKRSAFKRKTAQVIAISQLIAVIVKKIILDKK
jgi:hypothetical protein